jgi:hypothetical protein
LKNYLEYVSVLSSNLYWSHGLSRPGLRESPQAGIYFLQPLIHIVALGFLLGYGLRKKTVPPNLLLVLILTVLGGLLYSRALIKAHPTHVQFAFLPALITLSLLWAPPLRPAPAWKWSLRAILILALIYGAYFFRTFLPPEFKGKDYRELMGVRVMPEQARAFETISQFHQAASSPGDFAFPFQSLTYAYLGLVPQLPFDDQHYTFYPKYRKMFLEALERSRARYLIYDEEDIFWDYPIENCEPLFDYIDENYQPVKIERPVWIFERRPEPAPISILVRQEPMQVLNRENHFEFALNLPREIPPDYLEFEAEFQYPAEFLSRFSKPIVQCWFDGKRWRFSRAEMGAQRLNPQPGKHRFRIYPEYSADDLTIQITFPGAMNLAPSKITLENVQWRQFTIPSWDARPVYYSLLETRKP